MSFAAGRSRSKSITLFPPLNLHAGSKSTTLSLRFLRFFISLNW